MPGGGRMLTITLRGASHQSAIYGILSDIISTGCLSLFIPSGALDQIARRLISTQAVRDSKDRHAAHGSYARLHGYRATAQGDGA
jgi:hypothetical protein